MPRSEDIISHPLAPNSSCPPFSEGNPCPVQKTLFHTLQLLILPALHAPLRRHYFTPSNSYFFLLCLFLQDNLRPVEKTLLHTLQLLFLPFPPFLAMFPELWGEGVEVGS